ncbi:YdcF family protein [Pelotalea chapellei]|uniref:YdcF family protein n=1 Tax=Pelotalea chapellei TaxID=44671 RepID=A0ABS5UA50_9BACT|nr:YdcF family protein [Pelotalea chapellei]MBT1072573.1 YdcF family protein [Pelotalea chapellei]
MLEFQRIITSFLLPPGLIILLLLLSSFFFRNDCRRLSRINVFIALLLWLFSTPVFSDSLIGLLESQNSANVYDDHFDSIILLGGGIYEGVPDLNGTSAPTEDMLTRIVSAVRLYRRWKVPIIVSGGAPPEFTVPEAVVVRRFLLDMGVPEKHIILEIQSRDTMENAQNVAVICRMRGYVRPVVVTSAYHAKRASMAFNKASMKTTLAACNFRGATGRHYGWVTFLPSAEPIETSWRTIRESIGLVYYNLVL